MMVHHCESYCCCKPHFDQSMVKQSALVLVIQMVELMEEWSTMMAHHWEVWCWREPHFDPSTTAHLTLVLETAMEKPTDEGSMRHVTGCSGDTLSCTLTCQRL